MDEERKKIQREANREKVAALEKQSAELRAEKALDIESIKERCDRKITADTGLWRQCRSWCIGTIQFMHTLIPSGCTVFW